MSWLFFWLGFCFLATAQALKNITIDSRNSSIVYHPPSGWVWIGDDSGGHMLANDSTATATFTFLGVAIYFSSPLWPYPVTSLVSLDSGIPILLDLQDHNSTPVANGMGAATVNAKVSWGVTGLNNTNHTLVVSVGPSKPYAVLDTLIYTVIEPGDITSSSSSASTTHASTLSSTLCSGTMSPDPTSTSTPTPTPTFSTPGLTSTAKLVISLSSILGSLVFALTAFAIWFLALRRRTPHHDPYDPGPPAPNFRFSWGSGPRAI